MPKTRQGNHLIDRTSEFDVLVRDAGSKTLRFVGAPALLQQTMAGVFPALGVSQATRHRSADEIKVGEVTVQLAPIDVELSALAGDPDTLNAVTAQLIDGSLNANYIMPEKREELDLVCGVQGPGGMSKPHLTVLLISADCANNSGSLAATISGCRHRAGRPRRDQSLLMVWLVFGDTSPRWDYIRDPCSPERPRVVGALIESLAGKLGVLPDLVHPVILPLSPPPFDDAVSLHLRQGMLSAVSNLRWRK